VEFALLLPLLVLLLFGIIEFGIVMNDYQSLRTGVREGARQGVVDNTGSSTGCLVGTTMPTEAEQLACQTKDRTSLGEDVRVRIVVTDGGDPGFGDDTVEVCAASPITSLTGLFSPVLGGRVMSSAVTMRAETSLSIPPGTYAEPAPADKSWGSLCD